MKKETKKINNSEEKLGITSRADNFSQWYLDIIKSADLAEYGPSKGSMVIKPHGYAIWELIKNELDKRIKKTGISNAYFPLLIPEKLLRKEQEHIEGFSPEIVAATYAGGKRLKEALIVRPTSETIIYKIISGWIRSYKDLPVLINQWANVVRWEMRPRLFLRTTEFLWQEGHTAHATNLEAKNRALKMLKVYQDFAKEILAIPTIAGVKTASERFAGAKETYTLEAMMQDGKALQLATSHDLGQNFSKPFGIKFIDEEGKLNYCYQTSWGMSTRVIGALIMAHSDDVGLILPPQIAPVQVVVVPIWPKEKDRKIVVKKAVNVYKRVRRIFRVELDASEQHAGQKFYEWERKGVPIRIEIGPKEVEQDKVLIVRRDTRTKRLVKIEILEEEIKRELIRMQNDLYEKALQFRNKRTVEVNNWVQFKKEIKKNNFVIAYFKEDKEIEQKIKIETGATARCIILEQKGRICKCMYSGKPTKTRVLFARAY